jgi:hypothetical protein
MASSLLLTEYRKERKFYQRLNFLIKSIANISLISFVCVLIFKKELNVELAVLPYFSLFHRFISIYLLKYYEFPGIILDFLQSNSIDSEPYQTIQMNANEILHPMFVSIHGLGYDRNYLNFSESDLKSHLISLEKYPWREYKRFIQLAYLIIFFGTIYLLVSTIIHE